MLALDHTGFLKNDIKDIAAVTTGIGFVADDITA